MSNAAKAIHSPCQFCKERYVGCHANCDNYKAYREDIAAYRKQEKRKNGSVNYDYGIHR